jgi:transketolase
MMKELLPFLEHAAYEMRKWSIKMTTHAGSGHPTSALSAADIMAVLFLHTMKFNPDDFKNPNNDRFILSKGHASPILYAAWQQVGKISQDELMTYREFNSTLEGHPTLRFPYTEAATGALGIGLSIGAGEALAAKMDGRDFRTFVLLGDSELSEGCIWEAVQLAAYYKLNNLIGVVDCNRLGQSTATMEAQEGQEAERLQGMFTAFGWYSYVVDGHDIQALIDAFDDAKTSKEQPVMVIAKTKKGYGVDLFEDKEGFHGKALNPEQEQIALAQLKKRFPDAAAYKGGFKWKPNLPITEKQMRVVAGKIKMPEIEGIDSQEVATRKAYGQALTALGSVSEEVVSLDAEVKNSTYAELFEKQFPDRFIQCFIAEQNMVSMAVGLNRRGKIPFASTFAAFLTRAHDQIRMAAIGRAALRLVGSHAGVSIGQDGPSQMGLEDISMMRAIPDSIVLYPCDVVSTYKLVEQMARYDKGISYLRTTRMATPIVYDMDEEFTIGKCKLLKRSERDQLCVIAAGITVIEAIKAYEILQREGIYMSLIDLYSVKPLDVKTIQETVRKSGNKLITVEDHYMQGGLGEAVAVAVAQDGFEIIHLAVDQMPRSGTPEELMAFCNIDAQAIIKHARELSSR